MLLRRKKRRISTHLIRHSALLKPNNSVYLLPLYSLTAFINNSVYLLPLHSLTASINNSDLLIILIFSDRFHKILIHNSSDINRLV